MTSKKVMAHSTDSKLLHRGVKFDLELVQVASSKSGKMLSREVVRHPGAVLIVPVLEEPAGDQPGSVVMIRVHRHSLQRSILEFPAGTLEPGESPDACAPRELTEETGYRAATCEPVGRFYPSPGMSDELMHVYLANSLQPGPQKTEEDEFITTEIVPMDRVEQLIASGQLVDGKSIAAWFMLLSKKRLSNPGDRP